VEASAKNGVNDGSGDTKAMRARHEVMRGERGYWGDKWQKEISGGGRR
jgi:hypothetical protein